MQDIDRSTKEAPARVLALLVAANGHIHTDELTTLERLDGFGRLGVSRARFIDLARSVYFQNDERARIKKEINLALGSSYVEEKSYADYRARSATPAP